MPLVTQVGRTNDAKPQGVAPVEEFSGDESSLYGLPDANVIRDEHSNWIQLECHYERHELVRAWTDRQASEAAEWACSAAQAESGGVA